MMEEYKTKVKIIATIFAAIKRHEDRAGLFSVAFPYGGKTLRSGILCSCAGWSRHHVRMILANWRVLANFREMMAPARSLLLGFAIV
jgi:hypothetical protein